VQLGQGAHGEEHFVQQAAADRLLVLSGRNVEAANQPLVILQHVKRIADRVAPFKRHAAGKGMRIQEPLDEIQCAAVVPMEFFSPMAGFFE
jgi:hypothetical protein